MHRIQIFLIYINIGVLQQCMQRCEDNYDVDDDDDSDDNT